LSQVPSFHPYPSNLHAMRKRIAFRQLSRTSAHRWSMLCNMVTSLVNHERIVTTVPKAKELRRIADKVVGFAKDGMFIVHPFYLLDV
jgi:ribosomal protein L17